MATLDPNMPTDEPPPEAPQEMGGAQVPPDTMNAPMAEGMQDATPEEQQMYEQFVGRAWQLIYDDRTFPHIVEILRGGQGPATPESGAEGGAPPGAVPPEPGAAPPPPEAGGVPPAAPLPAGGGPVPGGPPPEAMPPEAAAPEEGALPPEGAPGDPVAGLASATDMVVAKVGEAAEQAGQELQPDVVFHAAGDIFEELAEISRRAKIKDYTEDPDALQTAWFQALDLYRERLQSAGAIDQPHAQADLERLIKADADGTFEKIMRTLADSDDFWPRRWPGTATAKREKAERLQRGYGDLRWLDFLERLLVEQ